MGVLKSIVKGIVGVVFTDDGLSVPDIIDNGDLSGVVGDIVITEVSVEVTGVVTVVVGLVINVVCFV